MTFALGTFLVLLFILPGIFFRLAYLQGPYSRQSFKPSTTDEIIWAMVPAFLFHLVAYFFIDLLTPFSVDLAGIAKVFSEGLEQSGIFTRANVYMFALYFFLLLLVSYYAGRTLRNNVIKYHIDYNNSFFRLNNEWFYQFNPYPKRTDGNNNGQFHEIEFLQLDVAVKGNDNNLILYSGILVDFVLSKEEGLDRIVLSSVYRRKFSEDVKREFKENITHLSETKAFDHRYYEMPGNSFIIPYREILNINISSYKLVSSPVEATIE